MTSEIHRANKVCIAHWLKLDEDRKKKYGRSHNHITPLVSSDARFF